MMKSSRQTAYVFLSIILHVLIFGLIVYWQASSSSSSLWSGGRGDGSVQIEYVDLGIVRVEPGTLDGVKDRALNQTPLDPVSKKAIKLKKIVKKHKGPKSKKGKSLVKVDASLKNKGSHQSSGKGDSDTPAGGVGSGLDASGKVSKQAPNSLALIRKKIIRKKRYPLRAKENNWMGEVKVNFKILESGELAFVRVSKSSGHKILDDAAVSAVKKAAPFPYYDKAIALTLEFRLVR